MYNAYERMKGLLNTAGIDTFDRGESDGEMYAYAKCLEQVCQRLDGILSKLLLKEEYDFSAYLQLLDIDSARLGEGEAEAEITARLRHSVLDCTAETVEAAFRRVRSGKMSISGRDMTFSEVHGEDLQELGSFLRSFLFLGGNAIYDGEGMTFNEWESMDFTFFEYDKMLLPFGILDNYRRSE